MPMSFRLAASTVVACVVMVATLAACTQDPARTAAARKATYAAAAGAPVRSFRLDRPLWSWEALDADQLVVYTKADEAWLLDVPGCNRLPYANVIGLTSNLHEVVVRFDRVLTGRNDFPCFITRIRPLDVAKIKAMQQQARRPIEEQARPADGGPHVR
jgi:hypothetical protein